jgi:hypothetical protein
MGVHSPLNAFSFDISLIEIGQEIKLLEHLKKKWITLYNAHNNLFFVFALLYRVIINYCGPS